MFVVISIKVSMYTNDRTFGKFVTNEGKRTLTEKVQDMEKGVSDKEDNVNVGD
jgi:hypothetical protein